MGKWRYNVYSKRKIEKAREPDERQKKTISCHLWLCNVWRKLKSNRIFVTLSVRRVPSWRLQVECFLSLREMLFSIGRCTLSWHGLVRKVPRHGNTWLSHLNSAGHFRCHQFHLRDSKKETYSRFFWQGEKYTSTFCYLQNPDIFFTVFCVFHQVRKIWWQFCVPWEFCVHFMYLMENCVIRNVECEGQMALLTKPLRLSVCYQWCSLHVLMDFFHSFQFLCTAF